MCAPPKYVCLKLPTFANGGDEQLVPLEIVGERAQLLATFARVEHTPGKGPGAPVRIYNCNS